MTLYLQADKVEELPEKLRAGAKEVGGKYLSGLGDFSVSDERALKSALAEERRIRKLQAGVLKDFGWSLSEDGSEWAQQGLDPVVAHDLHDKHKAGGLKSTKELDDFRSQLQDKFARDSKDKDARIRTVEQQLAEQLVDREAIQAIQLHNGSVKLLLPVVKNAARIERDADGRSKVTLVGDDGKILITTRSGSTDPMGFAEFVEGLKKLGEFKPAFSGLGVGGAGTTSQRGGAATAGTGRGDAPAILSSRDLLQRANDRTAAGIGHI